MRMTLDFDEKEVTIEISPGDKLAGEIYNGPHVIKKFKVSNEELEMITTRTTSPLPSQMN